MKPYRDYKESGFKSVPRVPSHWSIKRLKFLARMNPSVLRPLLGSDLVTFLPMESVSTRGEIDCSQKRTVESVSTGFTCFERDDVIMAKITPCFENGKGAFLKNLETDIGFGSTEFIVLRANKLARPKYIYYITYSGVFRKLGEQNMSGSAGQQRVRSEFVMDYPCPYPSLAEQDAIVSFLEAKERDIAAFIENKRRTIELLKEHKTALINRAVTRGLNPNVKLKASGIPCIPLIPEHWSVRRNGSLFRERVETGFPDLPILVVSLNTAVTVEDYSGDRPKRQIEDRNLYKRTVKGDIAYNMMRMWQGAVGEVPCDGLVSPAYVVARPLQLTFSPYYAHLFRTDAYKTEINRESRGIVTDRNRLYWDDFKQMYSPFPPIDEQREIVKFLNAESNAIANAVATCEREMALMEEYRTALISDAVTGKIDVRKESPCR